MEEEELIKGREVKAKRSLRGVWKRGIDAPLMSNLSAFSMIGEQTMPLGRAAGRVQISPSPQSGDTFLFRLHVKRSASQTQASTSGARMGIYQKKLFFLAGCSPREFWEGQSVCSPRGKDGAAGHPILAQAFLYSDSSGVYIQPSTRSDQVSLSRSRYINVEDKWSGERGEVAPPLTVGWRALVFTLGE